MAVVFGECGRECLSGPGNTENGNGEMENFSYYPHQDTCMQAEEEATKFLSNFLIARFRLNIMQYS